MTVSGWVRMTSSQNGAGYGGMAGYDGQRYHGGDYQYQNQNQNQNQQGFRSNNQFQQQVRAGFWLLFISVFSFFFSILSGAIWFACEFTEPVSLFV
jgi:hypothetical protein